ncbi:HAMP domain-containing sensor histidine kinase [Niabella insulamsoli]|uniref:sensor histidine kinase n=1 Tax=Niabella insulamsoli TaxID=3144874 RepID=UPI0031FCD019
MKLGTKLVLFATLSSLCIALLMILILPLFVKIVADRNTNAALRSQKSKVIKEIEANGLDYYLEGDSIYGSYSMLKDEYISIEPGNENQLADQIKTERRIVDQDTIVYRILTHTMRVSDKNYFIEIGRKISSISQDGRAMQKMALYVLAGIVILILLANVFYTRHLLRPLNYINTKLLNIKFPFTDTSPPVKTSTFDFKYLDQVISGLMVQINRDFRKEKEFSSNASHELMTPISIIQSKLENMIADASMRPAQVAKMEEIMRTLHRLKKIAKSLLLISRIDNDQYIREDTTSVKGLIEEVTGELHHRLVQKQLKLNNHLQQNVLLKNVNKVLLFQLFYNVLNNAIQYNKPRGVIDISDQLIGNQKYAVVIKDTGSGISEAQLPFIFDRFKRTTGASPDSNGLGLSIVHSIAQYHNLELAVSSDTSGTAFQIIFSNEHI